MQKHSLALLVSLSACGGGDDVTIDDALRADLQTIIDGAVANQVTPGAVLHVAAGGDSFTTAAGVADLDTGAAMTPDMHFRAGSMIKPLLATAVLQAMEAGRLDLDDRLAVHLPPAVTDRIPNAGTITIRMLLQHRSGIPEWLDDAVYQVVASDPAHVWTLDEILTHSAAKPPVFAPDAGYSYSNTNYILLGEILTAVSGRPWREVVRDGVIARAGLDQTFLPLPGDLECPAPCAHGYVPTPGGLIDATRVDPSMAGASGGHALISTVTDVSRFLQTLQTGALFDDDSTRDAMFATLPASDPEVLGIAYGMGIQMYEVDGTIAIGHLGGAAGYRGFTLYVPETDRYVSGDINVMGDIGAVLTPIVERVARP